MLAYTPQVQKIVGLIHVLVRPKTITLVFATILLNRQHEGLASTLTG
jgi:hypothetical protein